MQVLHHNAFVTSDNETIKCTPLIIPGKNVYIENRIFFSEIKKESKKKLH